MATTTTSLSEKVETYVGARLRHAEVGDKLPSVRKIMRDCGVSQAVVDRVLAGYRAEGLIEVHPRSGFYRAKNRRSPFPLLTILLFGDPGQLKPSGFANDLMGYLTGQLARRGESLRVRLMETEPDCQRVVDDIVRQKPPLVATYSIETSHIYLARDLNMRGIPCLHIFPNMADVVGPCLTIHNETLVRRQVEHLVKLGHRRIAYLHAISEDACFQVHRARRDAFCRMCLEYNLDVRYDWVRYVGWNTEYIHSQVRDIMTREGPKPTSLIIFDENVNPTYAALRECGFIPGKDVSVVGTDDMPWAAHVAPPLTTVCAPRIQSADIVCEMMDEIAAGRDPGVRYLETNMVVRKSTCAVSDVVQT